MDAKTGSPNVQAVTLRGAGVRLEPLSLEHLDSLCAVGLEGDVFRWFPYPVLSQQEMREYIETALLHQRQGTAVPFATVDLASGLVAGSTRFMNIDAANHHVEIGSTWVGRAWQRTHVNTESKYLMLRHAFETLGCMRVELKTDSLNQQSRTAMLRLGAKEEGIFRNHMVCRDGRLRHTVWFSIIAEEWPEVKARLEEKLCVG